MAGILGGESRPLKAGEAVGRGGLDQEDLALEGFIKLMKYLRVVLLQDIAVLQGGKFSFLLLF